MPDLTTEKCLGGHAVLCVGYDDSKSHWIMRNSWGAEWGDKGYFYLPYPYLLNQDLTSDLWNITKVKPSKLGVKELLDQICDLRCQLNDVYGHIDNLKSQLKSVDEIKDEPAK